MVIHFRISLVEVAMDPDLQFIVYSEQIHSHLLFYVLNIKECKSLKKQKS